MVSHWCLSDSKSPQVSRILISILADLNIAVVWMVSTRPLISKSSGPCTNTLVTIPRTPFTTGIIITFMLHCFSIPKQGPDIYPSFRFLSILLRGQLEQQSTQFCTFSFIFFYFFLLLFFVDYYKVWYSGRD